MTRIWWIAAGAVAVIAALASVGLASAHARWKASTPDKGEVLAASPASVTITFTQDVQKISGTYGIDVMNAAGATVTSGPATLDDNDRSKMSAPLQSGLPAGRYEVRWKNVSDADGDPAEGAFSFYVGSGPTAADAAADAELEKVGAEEETPKATASVQATAVVTAIRTAVATPTNGNDDGGDSNATTYVVIIVVVAAVVGVAGAAWWYMRRRRT